MITRGTVEWPWGSLAVEVGPAGVYRLAFARSPWPPLTGVWADVLHAYAEGQPIPLDLPVDLAGVPPFSRRVLEACRLIPFGVTVTYRALAQSLGAPGAARAVGGALARNPVPIVIPCHRVLGSTGKWTGFLGGEAWKRALLRHEGLDIHS